MHRRSRRDRGSRTAPRRRPQSWQPTTFLLLALTCAVGVAPLASQGSSELTPVTTANYRLGARFAPYKVRSLVYSTSVSPRWIEGSERFWYQWNTADGTFFYIVDPVAGTKRQIFDNDRIAAELTRITEDPYDGQHLPIRTIRFIDPNTIQFDVTSSQDDTVRNAEAERGEQQGQQQGRRARQRPRKKVFHFQFDLRTQILRELADYEAPDDHPGWASVSPDGKTVIFVRENNLYMMTGDEYQKVLDARRGKQGAQADSADQKLEVEETQLTTDGEENYDYGGRDFGQTDEQKEKS